MGAIRSTASDILYGRMQPYDYDHLAAAANEPSLVGKLREHTGRVRTALERAFVTTSLINYDDIAALILAFKLNEDNVDAEVVFGSYLLDRDQEPEPHVWVNTAYWLVDPTRDYLDAGRELMLLKDHEITHLEIEDFYRLGGTAWKGLQESEQLVPSQFKPTARDIDSYLEGVADIFQYDETTRSEVFELLGFSE